MGSIRSIHTCTVYKWDFTRLTYYSRVPIISTDHIKHIGDNKVCKSYTFLNVFYKYENSK